MLFPVWEFRRFIDESSAMTLMVVRHITDGKDGDVTDADADAQLETKAPFSLRLGLPSYKSRTELIYSRLNC